MYRKEENLSYLNSGDAALSFTPIKNGSQFSSARSEVCNLGLVVKLRY